jgi:hypothetical protein
LVQPKRHNLTVTAEIYERVSKIYKKEKTDKSLTQWISDKLLMVLEKDEFLKSYAPFLSKIAVNENSVILRDEKLQRLVEIIYRNNKFWCDVDEKECCAHVHFALALPELVKLRSK